MTPRCKAWLTRTAIALVLLVALGAYVAGIVSFAKSHKRRGSIPHRTTLQIRFNRR